MTISEIIVGVQAFPLNHLSSSIYARSFDEVDENVAILNVRPAGHTIHELGLIVFGVRIIVFLEPYQGDFSPSIGPSQLGIRKGDSRSFFPHPLERYSAARRSGHPRGVVHPLPRLSAVNRV